MVEKLLLAHLLDVVGELFKLFDGVLPEVAHFLSQGVVLWGRAGGTQVMGGLVAERVDGRCHGCILIL